MKETSPLIKPKTFCAFLLALPFIVPQFQAQIPPEWHDYSFLDSANPTFLVSIFPHSTQWVRVEISNDLSNWHPLVNLATPRTAIVYGDDTVPAVPIRFYRLASPGTSVDEARNFWQSQQIRDYQYRIQNVAGYTQRVYSGTVTIHAGAKTITDPQVNFEPSTNYTAADFPGVDELFDRLDAALTNTERILEASYDPERGFPWRCYIADPPLTCSISNFVVLNAQSPPPIGVKHLR